MAVTATSSGTKNNTTGAVTATAAGVALTGNTASSTLTVTSTVPTTLVLNSVSPSSVPFGSSGPVTFTATLTRNDTSAGVVGATVNFSVDSGTAIPATTGTGGVATFSTYNPSSLSVSTHNVAASFTAATISGTNFGASSSGTLPLTVTKASVTATVTANNKTYDGTTTATQNTCTLTGVLAADSGNVICSASTLNFVDKNVGNGKTVNVSGISLSGSAAGNYQLSSTTATASATINPLAVTVSAVSQTKAYGWRHGFDGSADHRARPDQPRQPQLHAGIRQPQRRQPDADAGRFGQRRQQRQQLRRDVCQRPPLARSTPLAITVSAATDSKPYDGTTSSAATPTYRGQP